MGLNETFSARLKRLRKHKGFSQKDVAKKIGVPVTTYREWEYGRLIQGEPYVEIAKALDVTLGELLTGHSPGYEKISQAVENVETAIASLKHEVQSFF